MKTKEELNAIKEEVESMNKKLAELTDEELKQVVGGKGSQDDWDWSVQDDSVPVTENDPCPRCHNHMIRLAYKSKFDTKPILYLCIQEGCNYKYTPPEWKLL